MSRERSPRLVAALQDVKAGKLSAYGAAKLYGVAQSTISRAQKHDAAPIPHILCHCCGHRVNKAKQPKIKPV